MIHTLTFPVLAMIAASVAILAGITYFILLMGEQEPTKLSILLVLVCPVILGFGLAYIF